MVSASFNVITGKKPQARVTDKCICVGPPDVIVKGSATVYVNKLPAARMGDRTAHGGVIMIGMPTVLIGDAGAAGPADFGAAAGFAPPADAPCLKKAAAGGSPFVKA